MCNVKLSRNRPDFEKLSRDRGQQPRTLYSSLSDISNFYISGQDNNCLTAIQLKQRRK